MSTPVLGSVLRDAFRAVVPEVIGGGVVSDGSTGGELLSPLDEPLEETPEDDEPLDEEDEPPPEDDEPPDEEPEEPDPPEEDPPPERGSWYWLSPALCARAAAGEAKAAMRATTVAVRRRCMDSERRGRPGVPRHDGAARARVRALLWHR